MSNKQNTERSLSLLGAISQAYSEAKVWFTVHLLTRVPLLLGVSLVAIFNQKFAAYVAIISIGIFLISKIFIEPKISTLTKQGASLQEVFDSEVLEIPLNNLLLTEKDMEEERCDYSDKYFKKNTKDGIKDWYPKAVDAVDVQARQIICQRTNSSWDSSLRRKYEQAYIGATVIIGILLVILGLVAELDLKEFVLIIIVPLIPIGEFTWEFAAKSHAAEAQANKNLAEAKRLFRAYKNNNSTTEELDIRVRSLQDAIFLHRSNSPLVYNWFYNRFRSKQEKVMNDSAEELVKQIAWSNV